MKGDIFRQLLHHPFRHLHSQEWEQIQPSLKQAASTLSVKSQAYGSALLRVLHYFPNAQLTCIRYLTQR